MNRVTKITLTTKGNVCRDVIIKQYVTLLSGCVTGNQLSVKVGITFIFEFHSISSL
jgi:hypothetical protein